MILDVKFASFGCWGISLELTNQSLYSCFQQFITEMKQDHLARSLVHLAICITNTMLEESAMELLAPGDKEDDTAGESEETESKPPPRKGWS